MISTILFIAAVFFLHVSVHNIILGSAMIRSKKYGDVEVNAIPPAALAAALAVLGVILL